MSAPPTERPQMRRVCVWFGKHKIVDHVADLATAARFEEAMGRRFGSLRVTSEAVGSGR
ncbi:hypothetical protein ACXJJ3_24045 [Kribbella sp. WER1]